MTASKILLLVGSPRKARSTSHAIGSLLLKDLEERGWDTGTLFIHEWFQSPEKMTSALQTIQSAHTLLLVFPLYVDQLPAPVIHLLEQMDTHCKEHPAPVKQKLMTVINCGFPETSQNKTASDIMEQFAGHMNMTWLGSLDLGMGGLISGRALHKAGGPARRLIKKLSAIVPYLDNGKVLPEQIKRNFGKPLVPRWLYTFFGNIGWKRQTRKNGVDPYARPYQY